MAQVDLAACSLAVGAAPVGCDWCGRPLLRNRRRWCSALCVSLFRRNHLWTSAREAALSRDRFACVRCGSKDGLEVNHIVPLAYSSRHRANPRAASCAHHMDNLETLCHSCHVETTNDQRAKGLIAPLPRKVR